MSSTQKTPEEIQREIDEINRKSNLDQILKVDETGTIIKIEIVISEEERLKRLKEQEEIDKINNNAGINNQVPPPARPSLSKDEIDKILAELDKNRQNQTIATADNTPQISVKRSIKSNQATAQALELVIDEAANNPANTGINIGFEFFDGSITVVVTSVTNKFKDIIDQKELDDVQFIEQLLLFIHTARVKVDKILSLQKTEEFLVLFNGPEATGTVKDCVDRINTNNRNSNLSKGTIGYKPHKTNPNALIISVVNYDFGVNINDIFDKELIYLIAKEAKLKQSHLTLLLAAVQDDAFNKKPRTGIIK